MANPRVRFVGVGLGAFGCKDDVYLVANLPIRGKPGCFPRQPVGLESVGKDDSVALCEF